MNITLQKFTMLGNMIVASVLVHLARMPIIMLFFVLPPFQIVGPFGKSRYISFDMHLDIHYVLIHSKIYISRFVKTTYNLERRKYNSEMCFKICCSHFNFFSVSKPLVGLFIILLLHNQNCFKLLSNKLHTLYSCLYSLPFLQC